ncbi:hypothetical protein [Paraburkholderia sp. BCC1884]|uniref:hypothetical protein n=1 Tax=Paraburkholderia sp. BCC1884 TaxID=2562668 RepID=UPI001642780A|nr:hypothetical protein [Paraburkholderia sp. BCC1884]
MGEYRDLRFNALVNSNADLPNDAARRKAFNDAFADQIALSIARQFSGEASR